MFMLCQTYSESRLRINNALNIKTLNKLNARNAHQMSNKHTYYAYTFTLKH
jgi:hypothetical protein